MKRLLFIMAAMMLLLVGCKKNTTPETEILISGSPEITVGEGASIGHFTFTANQDWTITSDASWIHIYPYKGQATEEGVTVNVSCDANNTTEPRSAIVTVTAGGATKEITVTQSTSFIAATGITISPSEATMTVGEKLYLTATLIPANATAQTIVWSRDLVVNEAPLEISEDGLVTALHAGSCNVTATCGELTATCHITVNPGTFTIYAYDGLNWGNMIFYGWDADQADPEEWAELEPVGVEDFNGHPFYKFVVSSEWCNYRLAVNFSDESKLNWSRTNIGYCTPNGTYFFNITLPYDDEHQATLLNIDDPAQFDPQPYVPSGPDLPEGTLFYSGFEDGVEGWTFIDADKDSYNWSQASEVMGTGYGHNGSNNMLLSQSYDNTAGALNPDNWAFTPAITLGSGNTLSLCLCGQDANYCAEHFAAYITETIPSGSDIASGCTLLMDGTIGEEFHIYTKAQTEWQEFIIPIPDDFNGKTVYFGFRHFNCTDQFYIDLDDIIVY